MPLPKTFRFLAGTIVAGLMLCPPAAADSHQPSLEDLKARIAKAAVSDRPPLCLQLSEMQLNAAGRYFALGDGDQAKAALTDVAAFAELARDYSIQSHKHEKQSEIGVRKMVRKLNDLKHTVTLEDQPQIDDTINRLQRVRDDLLAAMFPKGNKK